MDARFVMSLSDREVRLLSKILRYAQMVKLESGGKAVPLRRSREEAVKMRAEVARALAAGEKPKELAKKYSVSLPYIYIIKGKQNAQMALVALGGIFTGLWEPFLFVI